MTEGTPRHGASGRAPLTVALTLLLVFWLGSSARGGELRVIETHNVRDLVITFLSEAGEWRTGENRFVVEFHSAPHKRMIDVGAVALMATGPGATTASRASAELRTDRAAGRYVGRITFRTAGRGGSRWPGRDRRAGSLRSSRSTCTVDET